MATYQNNTLTNQDSTIIASLQVECEDLLETYHHMVHAGLMESISLEDTPVPYQSAPDPSNWQVNR